MIRCIIQMVPKGDESRAYTLGLIEIANVGGDERVGEYAVALKKQPPYRGALRLNWRAARLRANAEDAEIIAGRVDGFDRKRRGAYDLVFCALKACGLEGRNR